VLQSELLFQSVQDLVSIRWVTARERVNRLIDKEMKAGLCFGKTTISHPLLYVNYHLSHIGMLIYVHVILEMPHALL
jgi:hypothetical protein